MPVCLRVKTLDGSDHEFGNMPDEITFGEFRDLVAEATNVTRQRQRLIFHGRVLQNDETKLSELGLDGKTLHLVERPPPDEMQRAHEAPLSPHPDDAPPAARRNLIVGNFPVVLHSNLTQPQLEALVRQALDRLGALGRDATVESQPAVGGRVEMRLRLRATDGRVVNTPARALVEHVRHLVRHVNHILFHLERDSMPRLRSTGADEPAATAPTDGEASAADADDAEADEDAIERNMSPLVGDCSDRRHESHDADDADPQQDDEAAATANGDDARPTVRHAALPDLVQLHEQVEQVQTRFRPIIARYQEILREEEDFSGNVTMGRETARFFNGVQVALHNLSHIYHALSDFNVHFCERPPRNVYPQFRGVEVTEPNEAMVSLLFEQATAAQMRMLNDESRIVAGRPYNGAGFPATMAVPRFAAAGQPRRAAAARIRLPIRPNADSPIGNAVAPHAVFGQQPGTVRMHMGPRGVRFAAGAGTPRPAAPQVGAAPRRVFIGHAAAPRMPPPRMPAPRPQQHQFAGFTAIGNDDAAVDEATQAMAASAIFMGPRPPSDLPLYTFDPFLPCPSRHFDPRRLRQQQRRRERAQSATAAAGESAATDGSAQQTQPSANGAERSAPLGSGDRPFQNDDEFIATLEQMLRSVVANMVDNDDSHEQQIYAFQPVTQQQTNVITGTVTVETGPVEVAVQQPQQPAAADGQGNDGNAAAGSYTNVMTAVMQSLMGGSQQTIGDLVRGAGETVENDAPGLVGQVLRCLAETFTVHDLTTLIAGDVAPLDRVRPALRRFLIEQVMNGNDRPSDEDVASAADRLLTPADAIEQYLPGVADFAAADADGRQIAPLATLQAVERRALERVLRLVVARTNGAADSHFGRSLYDTMWQFIAETVYLIEMMAPGPNGYEHVVQRYLRSVITDLPSEMIEFTVTGGLAQLRNALSRNTAVTEDMVRQYFVYREIEDAVDDVPTELPTQNGVHANCDSDSEASWKRTLPSDWVTVIERDLETQRSEPAQGPLSDAYLMGMPAKRRKTLLESRPKPAAGVGALLGENLTTAIEQSRAQTVTGEQTADVVGAAAGSGALVDAYAAQLRAALRRRLQRDADFRPDRFPNSSAHFAP